MKRPLLALVALLFTLPAFGATCKISEYTLLVEDDAGRIVSAAREPAIATQSVTYTTSAQSVAFNSRTDFIRIVCDAKAHFKFGANPTATATDPYVPADIAEYFGIPDSGTWEVAFYDGSS